MNYKIVEVHKNDIKNGDMILFDGKIRTVNNKNIKYDSFVGVTLFGYSYKLGYEKVKKVILKEVTK